MSDAARLLPISPLQTPKSPFLPSNRLVFSPFGSSRLLTDSCRCFKIKDDVNAGSLKPFTNFSQQGSISGIDSSSPVSIDLKPIVNECQFDRVIADAQQLEESVVLLWMANWCRKCIYLKPKLEKLAADYHPRVRFYCIDVNNVPYQLVIRAGVTKMPTIQLWKNGKKQAEVIGGHKAYLVANEVREMIDDEDNKQCILQKLIVFDHLQSLSLLSKKSSMPLTSQASMGYLPSQQSVVVDRIKESPSQNET